MPTLKAIYGADETVPDTYQDLFTKNDNGEHVLTGVEGALLARDHERLITTLDHVRKNENDMKRELAKWRELVADDENASPDSIKQVLARVPDLEKSLEEAAAGGAAAVDAAVRERVSVLEREHQGQIVALNNKLEGVTSERDAAIGRIKDGVFHDLVAGAVRDVTNPGAENDVISRARSFGWMLNEDEQLVAVTASGAPVYSRADPAVPMGFKEWVERILMNDAPYLFKQPSGTGDRAQGTGRPGSPGFDWSKAGSKDKAAAVREAVKSGVDPQTLIRLPKTG